MLSTNMKNACGLEAILTVFSGSVSKLEVFVCGVRQQCRKCSETKLAEEFPQKKSHPDGRDDYCKACHARATAARVAARGPVKEPTVDSKVNLPFNPHRSACAAWTPTAVHSLDPPHASPRCLSDNAFSELPRSSICLGYLCGW